MRRSMLLFVTLATMLVACSPAGPAASPTAPPTTSPSISPTASPTAPATASPTATSSATEGVTPRPTPCDPYYGDVCDGTGPTQTPAQGSTTVSTITYGEAGAYLAGPTRLALYTFDNDGPGASSCTGDCAGTWPPLTIAMGETPTAGPGMTGTLGTIQRADGSYQVTYNDMPLYHYAGDVALYDTNGDGVGGVWHLARP